MADDIVARLRDIAAHCWCAEKSQGEPVGKPFFRCESCDDQLCAADEIERLQAIVTTVDDLHSPRLAHDTCLACDHNWPCPTHLLIHPEEARRG